MTLQELKDKVRLLGFDQGLPACWLGHSLGMAACGMRQAVPWMWATRAHIEVPANSQKAADQPVQAVSLSSPRLAGLPPGER